MRRYLRISFFGFIYLTLVSALFSEEIRIATYNLNNYLVMDRHVGSRWRPSYPKPENEKSVIRQIVHDVKPDILVVQEMGSVEFLEELRADLDREGLHYKYAIHMRGEDPDRHLAVLTNLPPKEVVKHRDLDFKYFEGRKKVKRGMLEVTFSMGKGQIFRLFAVHLKSRFAENKKDQLSAMRRAREAEACRNRIIERTHDLLLRNYLIVGDFNDHPSSAPMRRFYRKGKLDLGSLVPASDSRGEVWTYFYEKEARYESVDGFVASPAIMPRIKAGRAKIVDAPGALIGSDHRMIYLDLATPAANSVKAAD